MTPKERPSVARPDDYAIRAELADIESDPRLTQRTAIVQVNAPLALVQTALEAKSATLRWVLGERPIDWEKRRKP